MRAVLGPQSSDPFLTLFVHHLFQKYWYNEADKMYILYNTQNETGYVPELMQLLTKDPKVSFLYQPYSVSHGDGIKQLLNISLGEYVMLLEDDGFMFTPGKVDGYFRLLESNAFDIIGSPRRSCGQEIWDKSKEKYDIDYSGVGDKGPNLWPNFLFARRDFLMRTDQNFNSVLFKAGEYNKELDHTFTEDTAGDTFVFASMQLRNLGARIKEIPQYHTSPGEVEDKALHRGNWAEGWPPYLHGGSLSSGWSYNGFLRQLQRVVDKTDVETRVALWQLALDYTTGIDSLRPSYQAGITRLIEEGVLRQANVQEKYNLYYDIIRP